MNDEAAFVAAIAATPDDQHLPLIFADWLDDHGDPRGQWLRNDYVRRWMPPTYENPIPKLLESLRKSVRVTEVRRAATVIGEPIVPGLIELLKHEKERVRQQACMCLRNIGKRAKFAVPALLEILGDSDSDVREQAAKSLKAIGTGDVTDTDQLKAALTDKNGSVRRVASEVLGSMKAKGSVLQELVEKFNSPDLTDRLDVIEGLTALGTSEAIRALDRALDDPEPGVREKAIESLCRWGSEARQSLCRALKDPLTSIRVRAAKGIHRYSMTAQAVDTLTELLNDNVPAMRRAAVDALSQVREHFVPPLVPRVVKLLGDLDEDVQQGAIVALGNLAHGNPVALVALIAQLGGPRFEHRVVAVRAVSIVGRDNPVALTALLSSLDDPSEQVAQAATSAISEWQKLPASAAAPLLARLRHAPGDDHWGVAISAALTGLGRIEPLTTEVLDALRESVRSPQQDTQIAAIRALAKLGPAAAPAVPDIVAVLYGDASYQVYQDAAAALARIGGSGHDELAWLLDYGTSYDHMQVIRSLSGVSRNALPLLPALLRLFQRTDEDWHSDDVADAIRSFGTDAVAVLPDLLAFLEGDASPIARMGALRILAGFGSALVPHLSRLAELSGRPECADSCVWFAELFSALAPGEPLAREPLRALLRDAQVPPVDWNQHNYRQRTRLICAAALVRYGDALLTDLGPLVNDPEPVVRAEAVYLLARLDAPAVLPFLRLALDDQDEPVRIRAIEMLIRRNDTADETLAALVQCAEHRTPKVRRAAIDALGKLKVGTDAVLAALAAATEDTDKKVAERAGVALRKLTPKEPKANPPKSKKSPSPTKDKK